MFSYLFKIFPHFNKSNKIKFFIISLLMSFCAILEAIGIGAILPFLAILIDKSINTKYPAISAILETLNINNQIELINFFLIFFVLVYFLKSSIVILTYWIQTNFLKNLEIHLKTKLFKKYIMAPYNYFLSVNTSTVLRNLGAITHHVDGYQLPLLVLTAEIFITFTITSLLLYSAFQAGIFLFIFFAFNIYFFQLFTKKKLSIWGKTYLKLQATSFKIFHHSMQGIKVIKVFGKENFFFNAFLSTEKKHGSVKRNIKFVSQLPRVWLEMISILGLCLLMFFLISKNPDVTEMLSIIAVYFVAAFRLLPSANRIINAVNEIRNSIPATKLIIEEFNNISLSKNHDSFQSIDFNESFKLQNISFRYDKSENNIIENVNLTFRKGVCAGFVGKSGSGKSTLIDVLIGLLPPREGIICVDDMVIDSSSNSWQKLIGYVSQNIYLTDDSIKNNIAFGLNNDEIDEKLLDYSIKAAQLNEFIHSLPNNLDTVVGEHGIRLSGGQRQRIALARALYKNPPILVFDEATSSLDTKTEMEIMLAIKNLKGIKTILIIAHRLSTLEYCDEIYEVKKGKVIKK